MKSKIKMKRENKIKSTVNDLDTQVLSVEQVDESCIKVNIRELDRELCTQWSTLYTKST